MSSYENSKTGPADEEQHNNITDEIPMSFIIQIFL